MIEQQCHDCHDVTAVERLTFCPTCGGVNVSEWRDPTRLGDIRPDELSSMGELEPRAPLWMRVANRLMGAALRRWNR